MLRIVVCLDVLCTTSFLLELQQQVALTELHVLNHVVEESICVGHGIDKLKAVRNSE